MALIEELEISWKDFWLKRGPAGRVIISDKRGPVAIVNNTQYGKLQDYAANHQIPLAPWWSNCARDPPRLLIRHCVIL